MLTFRFFCVPESVETAGGRPCSTSTSAANATARIIASIRGFCFLPLFASFCLFLPPFCPFLPLFLLSCFFGANFGGMIVSLLIAFVLPQGAAGFTVPMWIYNGDSSSANGNSNGNGAMNGASTTAAPTTTTAATSAATATTSRSSSSSCERTPSKSKSSSKSKSKVWYTVHQRSWFRQVL